MEWLLITMIGRNRVMNGFKSAFRKFPQAKDSVEPQLHIVNHLNFSCESVKI